jgi:hypothetical protein
MVIVQDDDSLAVPPLASCRANRFSRGTRCRWWSQMEGFTRDTPVAHLLYAVSTETTRATVLHDLKVLQT